jgi:hypothetical protein
MKSTTYICDFRTSLKEEYKLGEINYLMFPQISKSIIQTYLQEHIVHETLRIPTYTSPNMYTISDICLQREVLYILYIMLLNIESRFRTYWTLDESCDDKKVIIAVAVLQT